jgi:hypothetical protein
MFPEFQELFESQRKNVRDFQKRYEKNLIKQAANGDLFPNRDLQITRAGKKHQMWAPDGNLENKVHIQHSLICPDRDTRNHANGWEYRFRTSPVSLIHNYAEVIFEKSEVVRSALSIYKGFWRLRIQHLESAVYRGDFWPDSSERWGRRYPFELNTIEFLVPGLGQKLVNDFESQNFNVERVREFQLIGFGPNKQMTETKPVDAYEILKFLIDGIFDSINGYRDDCEHPSPVECGLCGDVLEPNLRQNTEYMLPESYCAWCVLVIDYHDETELLYDGIDEKFLRELMIRSFTRLVDLTGFPYWKTPVLTRDLMVEINLRERSSTEAREMAYLLACLPKRSKMKTLFETPQHFFHEAGLEQLIPKGKGRGVRSISRCGHLCLSMGEREICEYLHQHSIAHSKEPLYADLVGKATEFGAMRGDFLAGDIVIEFAGLEGEEAYDVKMNLKQQLANEYGLKLIIISPKDVKDLSNFLPLTLWL